MEELKVLIELVAELPQMALWVVIGFFVYKVIVIGSVFGLIKFFVGRLYSLLSEAVKARLEIIKIKGSEPKKLNISGMVISGNEHELIAQLSRLKSTTYIHGCDVDKLRSAIDEMKKNEK